VKVLIFTRYPKAGRVKSRLIPALGAKGAQSLHRRMTEHTLQRLDGFDGLEVCYDGGGERRMRKWLGNKLSYSPQGEGDLGKRLLHAFSRGFKQGEDKIVVVGTDCPDLTVSHVQEALQLLDDYDVVLGPAVDGGYYLICLGALFEDLFKNISWGTGQVLQETLKKAELLGLKTILLETLADVDRPEDLAVWDGVKDIS
jgi:uncharacterized protein